MRLNQTYRRQNRFHIFDAKMATEVPCTEPGCEDGQVERWGPLPWRDYGTIPCPRCGGYGWVRRL